MRRQYIVLQPLSPEHGPLILPAQPDRDTPDVAPEPVLVDETVISDEAAPILIERGVIALVSTPPAQGELLPGSSPDPGPPIPAPYAPAEPKERRRKP